MSSAIKSAGVLLGCCLIASALASYEGQYRYSPINQIVTWTRCQDYDGFDCGIFDSPLDHADPKQGKALIAVIRFNATKKRRGSIFINPGGPGLSGVEHVAALALNYTNLSGGFYDIIGFDPRGVGLTQPNINCFDSPEDQFNFLNGTLLYQGIEAKGNFTNQNETNPNVVAFLAQEHETDRIYYALGQKCWEMNGDHLRYVGTAAVVRDIVGMADLFDGPKAPINYWGFDYGTVIGSYLVNMFPDRVGHVILDGVVNPSVWATKPSYKSWSDSLQNTSDVFHGFAAACAMAGSAGCEIATTGSTPESIIQWTVDLMDAAYDFKRNGGSFGSANIRELIFGSLPSPTTWPPLASALYDYANQVWPSNNNGTSSRRRSLPEPLALSPVLSPPRARQPGRGSKVNYALQAITCADAVDRGTTTTMDVFNEVIYAALTETQLFAPSLIDGGFYCHKWVARAPERYTGPWNATPKIPILVIGNKADPITPLASAKFVADLLGNSAHLVEEDAYGHTSFAEHSNCTLGIIHNFLVNQVYPAGDQLCGTNQVLFPGQSVTKLTLDNGGSLNPMFDPRVPVPGTNIGLKNQELLEGDPVSLGVTENKTDPTPTTSAAYLRNQIGGLKQTCTGLYWAVGTASLVFLASLMLLAYTVSGSRWKTGKGQVYAAVDSLGDDHTYHATDSSSYTHQEYHGAEGGHHEREGGPLSSRESTEFERYEDPYGMPGGTSGSYSHIRR